MIYCFPKTVSIFMCFSKSYSARFGHLVQIVDDLGFIQIILAFLFGNTDLKISELLVFSSGTFKIHLVFHYHLLLDTHFFLISFRCFPQRHSVYGSMYTGQFGFEPVCLRDHEDNGEVMKILMTVQVHVSRKYLTEKVRPLRKFSNR